MKKTLSIIALSIIGFGLVSCKKDENKPQEETLLSGHPKDGIVKDTAAQAPVLPATGQENTTPQPDQPLTTIALSESNFDFGKIKKGEKVQHVYEITNTGTNPLVISEVKPGCGCTAPEFTKEPILPGKKGKITLSFDSTNFDNNVQKYADVYANVEKAPIKLTFTANIQP
ncbi:hypothetical protein HNP38_002892 [Chryseobacterium defluvii]|uniref:DUF1573 domain-containing protein n=1 Tax=Chryseobacterium defluvii TaxID=160396 RepID=A0A840KEI0_9FLAO|nr:DUF1573 domain-containing protein [Chryseobacterium defluvii]MBB4807586.1 hypothetical protein [Chryseobacterium defluvii]